MNAYLQIELSDFLPKGFEYVDYWSVCFGYTGTFISHWQAFRTRKDRSLEMVTAPHHCRVGDIVRVAVKAVDAFANEFNRVVDIEIPPPESYEESQWVSNGTSTTTF